MTVSPTLLHVLDKNDYSKHRLVEVPAESPSPLAPSSLRLRSKILGLTTNNFTYARLGGLDFTKWHNVYPMPENAPGLYTDKDAYARIAAWGYAEIVESTVPGVSAGQTMWGYLPISNSPVDLQVKFDENNGQQAKDLVFVQDEDRLKLWKVYNRYWIRGPLSELESKQVQDSLAWDTILGLWMTSYTLNNCAFAWEDQYRIQPSGMGEWSAADADLRGATVICLNASGKTGLAFAYSLRHDRPKEHQPATIIGVGSPASVGMIEKTGFYDKVVLNSDVDSTVSSVVQTSPKRVVIFDFGAREGANAAWNAAFHATSVPVTTINTGGAVTVMDSEAIMKMLASAGGSSAIQSNACFTIEKALEVDGNKWFDDMYQAFNGFKKADVGVKIQWGESMEGWEKGWETLLKDQVGADSMLVYKI